MRLNEISTNITTLIDKYNATKLNSINLDIQYYTDQLNRDYVTPERKAIFQVELDHAKEQLRKIEEYNKSNDILKELADKIKNECSKFYSIFKRSNAVLYRGIRHNKPAAFESNSPTDRRPKDSGLVNTLKFDRFAEQLGIIAQRSNSIFTSSDEDQARIYGDLYVVFPKSSADFSWSHAKKDLVLFAEKPLHFKDVQEFQQTYKLDQTNLPEALFSEHEVLIHGKYIAVRHDLYEDMIIEKLL